uniref:Putative odorant receptor 32 n=1 Tax=Conopomorpha sinensis TaxID=940481 RepID=A0A3Q8HM59_9NEOP|nr:putative odorant receptor 32 [Conopomorpha sinensis]
MIQESTILFVVSNYHLFFLFLLSHTAVMYRLLTMEITEMGNLTTDYDNHMQKRLCNIIKRHQLILGTIRQLRSLYSKPLGIDFFSNALCICLVQFVPVEEYPKFVFVLLYCLTLFFLYCLLCQMLTNESEKFGVAVYCCGWERVNLKEKKMIFEVLRQAQKPVVLLAADFVPVNLYTFASTCQIIYKFVTVMKF